MRFFHRNRPDGSGYPVPLMPQKPKNYVNSDTYGSFLADPRFSTKNKELPGPLRLVVKTLADGYNQVEHASVQEYGVYDRTLELLAMMDSKHETVREFESVFNKAIDSMSSLEDILAHITRENYSKGLHVHKLTKKIAEVQEKVGKTMSLMAKTYEKIERDYSAVMPKWGQAMQLQANVDKEISLIKEQFQDLLLGDATVSGGASSFP